MSADDIKAVAHLLSQASSLLIITGAGVSAESGLPTYRGLGGLYEGKTTEHGVPIEVALSGPMFAAHPEITLSYLSAVDVACRAAAPALGHRMIALLERRIARTWVLTQNIDGLHRAAGSRNVIEIHGNIHRSRCTTCGHREPVALSTGPCPRCGRPLRPDVVLFGEALPKDAANTLERELRRGFDVLMVIGTTAVFPYIVAPIVRAAREQVPTIEINPDETELSHFVRYHFAANAGPTLEAIVTAMG